MSTPASQVLSPAAPPAAPAAAPAAAPPAAAPPGTGQPAAANEGFWKDWNAPEQKETRDWIANKNYPDTFTLAKTAQGLERDAASLRVAANLKGYPAPGADGKVDPNVVKAWNTTMGVPETPDKYSLELPSGNPYPQFATYLQAAMHEAGVPAAMAPKLAQGYEAAVKKLEGEIRAQEDSQSKLQLAELQHAWGANYQERVALAQRGKEWLSTQVGGLDDMQLRTLEAVLGTTKFMTTMWKFAEGNKEPGFAASGAPPEGFTKTASAAQEEWNQVQAKRAAGGISDHEWREFSKAGGKMDELMNRIAAGNASVQ